MLLSVREAGPTEAPTIVFLHGGGFSRAMWQPQLDRLHEYHCLTPDLPEHGYRCTTTTSTGGSLRQEP